MATIDRAHKPFTNPLDEAHAAHNGRKTRRTGRSKGMQTAKKKLGKLVHVGRLLPRTLELECKAHPGPVLISVGAASFALGAVFGSKLGRLAVAAALPFAIRKILEGEIGEELGQMARDFISEQEAKLA